MLVTQLCLTLCDPLDSSLLGSSVQGTLQARILEWVAIPSSRGSFLHKDQTQVSRITGRLFTFWDDGEACAQHIYVYNVLVAQLCPTLCYPMDCSPPGSSVCRILQARMLELHFISISLQTSNEVSISSPGDLPDPGIEPGSPALQTDSLLSEPPGKPIYKYAHICTDHTESVCYTAEINTLWINKNFN